MGQEDAGDSFITCAPYSQLALTILVIMLTARVCGFTERDDRCFQASFVSSRFIADVFVPDGVPYTSKASQPRTTRHSTVVADAEFCFCLTGASKDKISK